MQLRLIESREFGTSSVTRTGSSMGELIDGRLREASQVLEQALQGHMRGIITLRVEEGDDL